MVDNDAGAPLVSQRRAKLIINQISQNCRIMAACVMHEAHEDSYRYYNITLVAAIVS